MLCVSVQVLYSGILRYVGADTPDICGESDADTGAPSLLLLLLLLLRSQPNKAKLKATSSVKKKFFFIEVNNMAIPRVNMMNTILQEKWP